MDRIAVTGGNGTIGSAILRELDDAGYETVNVSRGSQETDADRYQRVDLLDAGAVYGSLARTDVDAVVHMGTIPNPVRNPGYETYRSNVQTAYHVLEAAQELDLDRVVLPSSVNVMGSGYQEAPMEVEYLPVDEDHPVTPRDPYALGKHAMEVTADGFGRLPEMCPIASLRFPWVAPGEYLHSRFSGRGEDVDALDDAWARGQRDGLFLYLHVVDAARIVRRCLEADLSGHERFWAVADDTCVEVPSVDLIADYYPDVEVRGEFEGRESLVSTGKARELLGWEPEHGWLDG